MATPGQRGGGRKQQVESWKKPGIVALLPFSPSLPSAPLSEGGAAQAAVPPRPGRVYQDNPLWPLSVDRRLA